MYVSANEGVGGGAGLSGLPATGPGDSEAIFHPPMHPTTDHALKTYGCLTTACERLFTLARTLAPSQHAEVFSIGLGSLFRTFAHNLGAEWYSIQRLTSTELPPMDQWPINDEDPRRVIATKARHGHPVRAPRGPPPGPGDEQVAALGHRGRGTGLELDNVSIRAALTKPIGTPGVSGFVRCPDCQYELWNLSTPVCPECGRGFELGEWEFTASDARFACASCGERLSGTTPRELPWACPSCGDTVDASAVMVVPGESGNIVPRVGDADKLTRTGGLLCTAIMAFSVIVGVLTILTFARSGGRGPDLLMYFAIIGTMAGFAGAWPSGRGRRVFLVFALLICMGVASVVAIGLGNNQHRRSNLSLHYARMARGIIQAVEIHRQNNGSFPSNPQTLVDHGYVPIEIFYERGAAIPKTLASTQLPDGWIEVGMFRIDWNEPSWLALSNPSSSAAAVIIAAPTQKLPGTSVGFADMHVEYYRWSTWPTRVQQLNADRAAAGMKPIPNAALPTAP